MGNAVTSVRVLDARGGRGRTRICRIKLRSRGGDQCLYVIGIGRRRRNEQEWNVSSRIVDHDLHGGVELAAQLLDRRIVQCSIVPIDGETNDLALEITHIDGYARVFL